MAGIDWLFSGQPPQNVTVGTGGQQTAPDWYMDYLRGVAGKGLEYASSPYPLYPGQRLADFNTTQQQAFRSVAGNQGAWMPAFGGALSTLSSAVPTASPQFQMSNQFGAGAVNAAARPTQNWTQNWQQYMSPFTSSVVDEIGRLGTRNLMENIIPQVNDAFIGAGQFGSSRNADILGRNIRDAQRDITGQQSMALQSGYGVGANIFGADAGRQLQQQQLQASTGLGAGALATTTGQALGNLGIEAGRQLGGLSQLQQSMLGTDAAALLGVGNQIQGLEQRGYDTSYESFINQRDWERNNLGYLSNLLRGYQMPMGNTTMTNAPLPNAGYSTSPLNYLQGIFAAGQMR